MNAISFILKEHQQIRKNLSAISKKKTYQAKQRQFIALCQFLIRHEAMEEKVWYPTFRRNKKLKTEVKHLISEEKHAEKAIKKFKGIHTAKEWEVKFKKLKKDVQHHAREEETKLFPNVRKLYDKDTLNDFGKRMERFKKTYKTKKLKMDGIYA